MGFHNREADSRLSQIIAEKKLARAERRVRPQASRSEMRGGLFPSTCYRRRHPVQTKVAQPPRNARPPSGVIAPAE